MDSIVEQGCSSPTNQKLPILLLHPEHQLGDEEAVLARETKDMVQLFQKCVLKTWTGIICQKVNIEKVKVVLLSHIGSLRNSSELAAAKDFASILDLLGNFQSWFNFEILQKLANEVLTAAPDDDEDFCSLWKEHSSKLHQYVTGREIRDYDGVMFGESKQHKRVYFKIDHQFDMQVTDLHALRSFISVILRCKRQDLYFVTFRSDIVVEFLIPLPFYEYFFPLSLEQLGELATIGMTAMETDELRCVPVIDNKTTSQVTHTLFHSHPPSLFSFPV